MVFKGLLFDKGRFMRISILFEAKALCIARHLGMYITDITTHQNLIIHSIHFLVSNARKTILNLNPQAVRNFYLTTPRA